MPEHMSVDSCYMTSGELSNVIQSFSLMLVDLITGLMSHQMSAAARSLRHCVFSRVELVGWVLDQLEIQLSRYLCNGCA